MSHVQNSTLTQQPEQQFTTAAQMLAYIRPRASLTQSLNVKLLRDMVPQDKGVPSANDMLTALEDRGDVLLMRTLGPWRDMKFPTLGQKNSRGLGLLDQPLQGTDGEPGGNPGARYKAVFYDDVRVERAGKGLMPLKRLDTGEYGYEPGRCIGFQGVTSLTCAQNSSRIGQKWN